MDDGLKMNTRFILFFLPRFFIFAFVSFRLFNCNCSFYNNFMLTAKFVHSECITVKSKHIEVAKTTKPVQKKCTREERVWFHWLWFLGDGFWLRSNVLVSSHFNGIYFTTKKTPFPCNSMTFDVPLFFVISSSFKWCVFTIFTA